MPCVPMFDRMFYFSVRSVTINGKICDHIGGYPALQKCSATTAKHENQVRSDHGCSYSQPEGTCVFRELATVKLDALARDLISFEEGMRRHLMHFTLLQRHTTAGLKSELENPPTETWNEQIHSYGMRLPRAPKFIPPLQPRNPLYPPPNPKANWICLRNAATERKSYNNVIPLHRDPPLTLVDF